LSRLVRLDLSKNELKSLPEDFGSLINLRHLDLYNNQLETLPLSFGKLTKLRYLDLKGNPLQPAVLATTGPCLTAKDCQNAAIKVVPFMIALEKKVLKEQKVKQEREEKELELEAEREREQHRLAKKAARKERVMRERQERAEADSNAQTDVKVYSKPSEKAVAADKSSSTSGIISFIKTLVAVNFVLISLVVLFMKFMPQQSSDVMKFLPKPQQDLLKVIYEKVNESVFLPFAKAFDSNFRRI